MTLSHAEIVRRAKNRELDFDLDGDGLTTREELKYGLNPYAADSDGDRIPDGKELSYGSKPGIADDPEYEEYLEREREAEKEREEQERRDRERAREKEELQNRYVDRTCDLLCWPRHRTTYHQLYQDIGGDRSIGRPLDRMVFQSEINRGIAPSQAIYLISQSPWQQWQLAEGKIEPQQLQDYARELLDEYQFTQQQAHSPSSPTEDEEEAFEP